MASFSQWTRTCSVALILTWTLMTFPRWVRAEDGAGHGPVNVIVAGGMRTGSTELYNLARLVALAVDPNSVYGWHADTHGRKRLDEQMGFWRGQTYLILKAHRLRKDWMNDTDVVLFSQREPRSSLCSFGLMFRQGMLKESNSCAVWESTCNMLLKHEMRNQEIIGKSGHDQGRNPNIVHLRFEDLVDIEKAEKVIEVLRVAMNISEPFNRDQTTRVKGDMTRLKSFQVSMRNIGHEHHPYSLIHASHIHSSEERERCNKMAHCHDTPACRNFITYSENLRKHTPISS